MPPQRSSSCVQRRRTSQLNKGPATSYHSICPARTPSLLRHGLKQPRCSPMRIATEIGRRSTGLSWRSFSFWESPFKGPRNKGGAPVGPRRRTSCLPRAAQGASMVRPTTLV